MGTGNDLTDLLQQSEVQLAAIRKSRTSRTRALRLAAAVGDWDEFDRIAAGELDSATGDLAGDGGDDAEREGHEDGDGGPQPSGGSA